MLSTNFESYFSSTLLKSHVLLVFLANVFWHDSLLTSTDRLIALVTFNDPSKINGLSECGREGYSGKCFVI